ncbi:hypothetical protein DSLASN_13920 [Desulfoluna limicola]|uniref:BPL/LPL catalytic domain-containing protein n=1 Tax=Desulfoluna limicola TaxID=2810562 RepID=A0ABM7PDP6_9BACT|nr:hypothetical protein [Desulfoluna limicola]BCS95760.1 hypothetical protein DSLASN_13920 [Desulfoluna limicola]
MDLYSLGRVSWWESQCYYHALAYLGREGVILCSPDSPYVCLGLHDDLNQEIDEAFCRMHNLPIFRRETGGGVVLLHTGQVFYQVVLRKDNPMLPFRRELFFATVLQPAISVFRSLGIEAAHVPPADIKAGHRKCSGNGAGDIGDAAVYIGNMLIDFDFDTMSRVLKTPSPLFQSCFCAAMKNNMLTLSDHVENLSEEALVQGLASGFGRVFGELTPRDVDRPLREKALSLKGALTDCTWLSQPGRRRLKRRIKVAEGLFLEDADNRPVLIRDGKPCEQMVFAQHS